MENGENPSPGSFRADDRLAVSVSEAARLVGVGRTSIFRLIAAGELPVVRLGRRTLVRVADLQQLLDDRVSTGR